MHPDCPTCGGKDPVPGLARDSERTCWLRIGPRPYAVLHNLSEGHQTLSGL